MCPTSLGVSCGALPFAAGSGAGLGVHSVGAAVGSLWEPGRAE